MAQDRLLTLFHHPDREYTPVPFWFLNGRMDKAELRRQLEDFRAHGVYGAVLHQRMGFDPDVPYLSDCFFDWIGYIVETARELDMFVFLYDEGMYPSGAAGGQVVAQDPTYAAHGMRLCMDKPPESGVVFARIAARMPNMQYHPSRARLLTDGMQAKPGERMLYLVCDYSHGTIRGLLPTQDDGYPDAPPAADLLNPAAVQCFIRLTHEQYYARMGQHFGKTIRAMFTDEPHPMGRNAPADMRPWTTGLENAWIAEGHALTELPGLFLTMAQADTTRIEREYERFLMRQMLRTYYGPLRDWCEAHGIALTGHPAAADSIGLERAFTIPGQDLVWRWVAPGRTSIEGPESTQGHCAADSMLNSGKKRCLNECFGCCGPEGSQWGMTLTDVRWMLDFLLVRGVNLLCPHAFFYEMDPAISAQDRPPDVGPNNYWWPHFRTVADYITRMCGINAESEDAVELAVLTGSEHLPWAATKELQRHQIPFHYLEIDDLEKGRIENGALVVAGHTYRAIIAPPLADAPILHVVERLRELIEAGLCVIGPDSAGCEGIPDLIPELLALGYSPAVPVPACPDLRVSHRRMGGKQIIMIFNEGKKPWDGQIQLPTLGHIERWDAWRGQIVPLPSPAHHCQVHLEPKQSELLVLEKRNDPEPRIPGTVTRQQLDLSAAFSLTCLDGTVLPVPHLADWQTLPGLSDYNGALTYTASFTVDAVPDCAMLALGRVCEMAEVSVNGSPEHALLLPPFSLDVTQMLHPGQNTVTVRVTSVNVTAFEGKPWPCGLMGPVTLYLMENAPDL